MGNKNMVIHHLESIKNVMNSEHSKFLLQFLYNGIKLVRQTVVDKFGKDGASFLVSTFVQNLANLPFLNHNRVLEGDTADDGGDQPTQDADASMIWCLRCCFGVSFAFLILYAS